MLVQLKFTRDAVSCELIPFFLINPLMSSVTFSYLLKASEKRRLFDVLRGHKNVTLDINGLKDFSKTFQHLAGYSDKHL